MADENQQNPKDDNQPEIAPSTLFLEMMRRAAREAENQATQEEIDSQLGEPLTFEQAFSGEALTESQNSQEDIAEELEEAAIEEYIVEIESRAESEIVDEPELEPVVEIPPNMDSRVPIYEAPQLSQVEREARLEQQRIQRIRRRREQQFRRRVGIVGGFFRTSFITLVAAVMASTIFMWFLDAESINPSVGSVLYEADSTSAVVLVDITATVPPVTPNYLRRIGIVAGHHGPENDPGAICPDGLTEVEINFAVAQLVVRNLRERGFSVDLLDEFDPRLRDYKVATLVSIHSNDCSEYPGGASGFLVARAASRPSGGTDDILAECVAKYYQSATQLERRFALTLDMTDYHSFNEIHSLSPAAIIELGFMRDDRQFLIEQQDLIARAITDGILCFLNGENPIVNMTLTPVVTDSPTETPTGG